MTTSAAVRDSLVDLLRLDLVGPTPGHLHEHETLDRAPSRFYLTGFLIPYEAKETQRHDPLSEEGLEQVAGDGPRDDAAVPEKGSGRKAYFPSSLGLSVLVGPQTDSLEVLVTWGDYRRLDPPQVHDDADVPPARVAASVAASVVDRSTIASGMEGEAAGGELRRPVYWQRMPRQVPVTVQLPMPEVMTGPLRFNVPESEGLMLVVSVRRIAEQRQGHDNAGRAVDGWGRLPLPAGTRSVSVFLVNHQPPAPDERMDEAFIFQAGIRIRAKEPLVARPSLRGHDVDDWDEAVADLQYRDASEYAVGHGVASEALLAPDGGCHEVVSAWIPSAEVEKVVPGELSAEVELGMEAIAAMTSAAEVRARLGGLVTAYGRWIEAQRKTPLALAGEREVAGELLERAETARRRIEDGFAVLEEARALEAFRIAHRAMAAAARQRSPEDYKSGREPRWRPFQLAFLLMNLRGIADPTHVDRGLVDLLFFPTGGGKTEAYLGLAAFTLVLRRLRDPGIGSAGVSVLMRYTLRLLTLDQLGRAATLICALELERERAVETLGRWPFEIGLWVGQAATPNRMGRKGDNDKHSARARTLAFRNDDKRHPAPIPLENCPWCGTKFSRNSFTLQPSEDYPTNLRIVCTNRQCPFRGDRALPIVAVDEPIYRRLPCFLIATVDKFASLPWVGQAGALLGGADRHDASGFYGSSEPHGGVRLAAPLLPPALVIQDELHLISGPLGTMVGLYETAIDALASRPGPAAGDGEVHPVVGPKIVASTATVRRAERQIQALFCRHGVDVFPPPGPDRRDSFFARTVSAGVKNARRYVGIAAQGRSLKVVLLRTYLALLGGAQKAFDEAERAVRTVQKGGPGGRFAARVSERNPADPYMTLVGYFNSLRELGGSRRIVEDEVSSRLQAYETRMRVGESAGPFASRKINITDIVELTSRESTNKVAEAKRRLALTYRPDERERVDVAMATNMISVGLDITRLGLMVVLGQPKTTAEYIQATSRVGRDEERPGLVVTLLNIHRPRDRSHYERFSAYHATFYRAVEATSVTPFSPRAIDRGIAGVVVALGRHGHPKLTPPLGATEILSERPRLGFVAEILGHRAASQPSTGVGDGEAEGLRADVRGRAVDLLDEWARLSKLLEQNGTGLQYQKEVGDARPLLYDPLDPVVETDPVARKFRARRSLRDVEPNVNLWVRTLDGADVEIEEEA